MHTSNLRYALDEHRSATHTPAELEQTICRINDADIEHYWDTPFRRAVIRIVMHLIDTDNITHDTTIVTLAKIATAGSPHDNERTQTYIADHFETWVANGAKWLDPLIYYCGDNWEPYTDQQLADTLSELNETDWDTLAHLDAHVLRTPNIDADNAEAYYTHALWRHLRDNTNNWDLFLTLHTDNPANDLESATTATLVNA